MEKPRPNPALAVIAVLLVLMLLYVGSYLAIVQPRGVIVQRMYRDENGRMELGNWYYEYRIGGEASAFIFWPLEQIDRRVRPDAWPQ